jgi:hypothetical protein
MMPKKSKYRIVPTTNEKFGACWALKEGDSVIGTFISKQHAEIKKASLEKKSKEDFLLVKTVNQELKIED